MPMGFYPIDQAYRNCFLCAAVDALTEHKRHHPFKMGIFIGRLHWWHKEH
jgi:hypothetical protein